MRRFSRLALACLAIAAGNGAQGEEALHLLIPGAAGGGWDRTARGVGEALTASGLVNRVSFENLSGGGGARGIAHLIEAGDGTMLMVNSTPIVVRSLQGVFPQSFRDLTPLASVIGDYSVIAVRQQSEVTHVAQLATRMRAAPRAVAIGGGSVSGGTDHIVAALVFKGLGLDPRAVKYIPYDAGGKAMAGLLSGEVHALSSGYGEVVDLVDQGWVRIVCIAAPERLERAPAVPTCEEQGAAGGVFVNWRGFFMAPSTAGERAAQLRALLGELVTTAAWQTVRDRYGWLDLYRAGEDFVTLLEAQERALDEQLRALGLL